MSKNTALLNNYTANITKYNTNGNFTVPHDCTVAYALKGPGDLSKTEIYHNGARVDTVYVGYSTINACWGDFSAKSGDTVSFSSMYGGRVWVIY
jgi:hypothetical protein